MVRWASCHFKQLLPLCALVVLLSSCHLSLSKHKQTKHLKPQPSLAKSVEESLQAPFFSTGNWPKEGWWRLFNAPDLDHLIEEALAKNPSIQDVRKRIDRARQEATVVRSKLFPLLFFDAEITKKYLSKNGLYRAFNSHLPLNTNLIDLTLGFQYEFDFWGKNSNLFHAALGEVKAQMAEAAQVRLITTTSVAQAYFALKTNLLRKHLYEALFAVREDYLKLQQLRQHKALSSKLPPLLSEENLLEAKQLIESIDEEIAIDKHLINILVGRGPDEQLQLDASIPDLPESIAIPPSLSIDLLSRRPDLMAQIWRVKALAHEVGAAKADYFPDINLSAFIGLESVSYARLFQWQSGTGAAQPALHLPLFTAGAIRANIKAKRAEFDTAVYAYNQLVLQSVQEVADLLAMAKSIFSQKVAQERIVEKARERYELTALRRKKGLDDRLTDDLFHQELIEKKLEDVTLLYGQYLAVIKLIKAMGGGYQSELPLKGDS